jgi:hypothetical protein
LKPSAARSAHEAAPKSRKTALDVFQDRVEVALRRAGRRQPMNAPLRKEGGKGLIHVVERDAAEVRDPHQLGIGCKEKSHDGLCCVIAQAVTRAETQTEFVIEARIACALRYSRDVAIPYANRRG